MKEDVRKGKIAKVIVYKFDRMARSTTHLLSCLGMFQENHADFISVSEGIDTSTSVGRMVFTFLGAIGEFERSLIRERVKTGLERAKAEGVTLGRPIKGFAIDQAIKLRNEGKSYRYIARELNISVGKLHETLKAIETVHKTRQENAVDSRFINPVHNHVQ